VLCDTGNVALLKPAVQSSTKLPEQASLAVDGNASTTSCTQMDLSSEPWLAVDLGSQMDVSRVCVINDADPNHG